MPLYSLQEFPFSHKIALWKITEQKSDLINFLPNAFREEALAGITSKSEKHELQKIATKVLWHSVFNQNKNIEYDAHGKPFILDNKVQISISHSNDFVALFCAEHSQIGIDIEIIKEKIHRIKSRFLTEKELLFIDSNDTEKLYACWCVKEAVYKYNGKKGLSLKESIEIAPFQYNPNGGTITATIIPLSNKIIKLNYYKFEDYMLAYTLEHLT